MSTRAHVVRRGVSAVVAATVALTGATGIARADDAAPPHTAPLVPGIDAAAESPVAAQEPEADGTGDAEVVDTAAPAEDTEVAAPTAPAPAAVAERTPAPAAPAAPAAARGAAPATPALLGSSVTDPAADKVKVAWVDADPASAEPAVLPYTLQEALSAASAGGVVHVVAGDLGFTKALTVPRSVTVVSGGSTTIAAAWSVAADGVAFATAGSVTLTSTAANGRSVVTVPAGRTGVTLDGLHVVARDGFTGTTGLLVNGTSGTTVRDYRFDGGAGFVGGYGISARTAERVVVERAEIRNASVGYFVHGSETLATPPVLTDVSITAKTSGIQTGGGTGARFTRVSVAAGPEATTGAALDLATSTGAVLDGVSIAGFAHGVKSVATSGAGVRVSGSDIGATLVGIALGATDGATITDTAVHGSASPLNTSFGIDGSGTGVTLTDVEITAFPTGYRSRAASGAGLTATGLTVRGATAAGVVLGTTDGSTLSDVVLTGSAGTAAPSSTGVQLGGSQHVDLSGLTVSGYVTGVASGAVANAGPVKTGVSVTGSTFERVTGGIGLNNVGDVLVRDVRVVTDAPKGSGVYLREVVGARIEGLDVQGTAAADRRQGTNGIRTYYSRDIAIDRSTLIGGATGLYFDMTSGVTTTGTEVAHQDWCGVYTEVVLDWTMSGSDFHDNAAIGNLTINPTPSDIDPRNERRTASDVRWTGSTFTNHPVGLYLPLGFGGMEFDHNTVGGVPATFVIGAFPAHNVAVHDNDIAFTPATADSAAILVGTDAYTTLDTDDPTSSGITVTDNVFSGAGPFLRTGSVGGERTALSDTVLVVGNTFPADSVAIDARPNSGGTPNPDGVLVAVDARDHGDANDWGSVCRPTVPRTGYDGGGATVREERAGQVRYPEQCLDLSLTEGPTTHANPLRRGAYRTGDLVTWTLAPHNAGPTAAPAGWTVTQLLPDGVELVGLRGDGYTVRGLTATALDALGVDEDAAPLTVTVRITADAPATLRNVAYVAPLAPGLATDLDDDGYADVRIEHANPLDVPTLATDTVASGTNNDTEGVLVVAATGGVVPVRPAEPVVPVPPARPALPSRPQFSSAVLAVGDEDARLATTGVSAAGVALLGGGLALAGAALVRLRVRRGGRAGA